MIKAKEINNLANREGVRQQQIEKDYIISWILWGIYNNETLKDALIFKGGTCIKKVHLEDYRYSEDMDFTLNPDKEQDISYDEIYSAFNELFAEIKEAANINLSIPEDSKETHESGSIKFFIEYIGPLGGKGDNVKTDISRWEKLEFDVEHRTMLNRYSDLEEEGDVSEIMLQLPYMNSFERMLHFFKMMDIIGRSNTNIQLASRDYIRG